MIPTPGYAEQLQPVTHLLVVVSDESKSIASIVHINQPTKFTELGLKIKSKYY